MNKKIQQAPRALVAIAGLALIHSALVGTSDVSGQSTGEMSQVAQGAQVYGDMCGRCHNPRSPLERSDRDWVMIINHMRVRGNLTGGQVRTVLAFLQATNSDPGQRTASDATARHVAVSGDPASSDPALVSLGEMLITQKACIGCHIVGSGGGNVGPSLNGVVGRRDTRFLRQKLIDPTIDNASSMMPNLGLTAEEIEAILAFLANLGDETAAGASPDGL